MKIYFILTFCLIGMLSCNCPKTDKVETANTQTKRTIDSLKLKLNATEAQLLNVRVELAKCCGDKKSLDSLMGRD